MNEAQHREDCYARYLIRKVRTQPTGRDRDRALDELIAKMSKAGQERIKTRVRELWQETNRADLAPSSSTRGNRGKQYDAS